MSFKYKDEFTEEEYAALGRVVRSFACLEDDLARAAVCLEHEFQSDSYEIERRAERAVTASLDGRLDAFVAVYERKNGPDDWSKGFKSKISEAIAWRNAICHGRWSRGSCGGMCIEFFQRSFVKARLPPPMHCLTVEELLRMEQANLAAASYITQHFIREIVS